MTLYLTQRDVKSLLDMKGAIEAIEEAFKEMALSNIEMPPRVYLHFEKYNGILIAMPAYIKTIDAAGLKVVTVHPDNPRKYGSPAVIARIILNDPTKGEPLAIMDGTYITAMRTGAAGAVAAKYLSREDAETAAIIGCGVQGRAQLLGLCEVRAIQRVKVFDIIPSTMKRYVDEMKEKTGIDIQEAQSVEEAVKGVDIIVTCTPSKEPFLRGNMLESGVHISAIGADTSAKRELETDVLARADKIVVDFKPQAFIVGDFAIPMKEGTLKDEDVYAEMGEVVAGMKSGRESEEEITLFKATGLAIQDVGTAYKVYKLARDRGMGVEI